MGVDENKISLRPGGGSKSGSNENQISSRPGGGSKSGSNENQISSRPDGRSKSAGGGGGLPSNSFRPAPLHSFNRPSAPLNSSAPILQSNSDCVLNSSHEPSASHRPSVSLQSSHQPSTAPLQSSIRPPSRNSEQVTARPPSRNSEQVTTGSSSIARVGLQDQPVQRDSFLRVIENVPNMLRRDVVQSSKPAYIESSRWDENHDNQISRPDRTSEWRSQRTYLPPPPTSVKPDHTTSRHSEPMIADPVPWRTEPMKAGPVTGAEVPWSARRGNMSEKDKVVKTVKGILNKLTPEKFASLKDQLLNSGITTADILQGVISLVFDKAVTEPTFCFMYAELCVHLSSGLPEFPPEEPDGKPIHFKRVLLNTCQKEFEGADNMRAELKEMTGPQLQEKEQLIKRRTLGNIRFIAELFKQKMLPKPIVHFCIKELFGEDIKSPPIAENVEALCQLFSLIGKQLEEMGDSTTKQTKGAAKVVEKEISIFDSYMARLKNVGNDSRLESRIRFMVRDVIELRANKWIPRREEVKAKTISEIHTEAEKKLGLRPGSTKLKQQLDVDAPRVDSYNPMQSNYLERPPRLGDDDRDWRGIKTSRPAQNLRSSSRPATHPLQPTVSTSNSNLASAYKPFPAHQAATASAPNAHLLPHGKSSSRIFAKPPPFPNTKSALLFKDEKPFLPPGAKSSLISFHGGAPENQEYLDRPLLPGALKSSLISSKLSAQLEQDQVLDQKVQARECTTSNSAAHQDQRIKAGQKLTADDLERKAVALLEEYFNVRDLREATQCVQDLDSPGYHAQLLFKAISMALEQKEIHVKLVGDLIDHLFSHQTVSNSDIRNAFLQIAEQYDDFAIDVPLAPKYIGGLFGKSALNGAVDLKLLYDVLTKIQQEDIEGRKKMLATAINTIESDPKGKQLLSDQKAELSQCEKLVEEADDE
eukprot:PITA_28559